MNRGDQNAVLKDDPKRKRETPFTTRFSSAGAKMQIGFQRFSEFGANLKEAVETMQRAAEAKKGATVIRLQKKV